MSDPNPKKARALGINHVVLEVDDLGQALEFYGSIFAFTLRGKSDHNAFIDLGDQFIQLTLGRSQVPDTKRHFGKLDELTGSVAQTSKLDDDIQRRSDLLAHGAFRQSEARHQHHCFQTR